MQKGGWYVAVYSLGHRASLRPGVRGLPGVGDFPDGE